MAAEIARLEAGADDEGRAPSGVARGRAALHLRRRPQPAREIALCKAALWIETVEPGKPAVVSSTRPHPLRRQPDRRPRPGGHGRGHSRRRLQAAHRRRQNRLPRSQAAQQAGRAAPCKAACSPRTAWRKPPRRPPTGRHARRDDRRRRPQARRLGNRGQVPRKREAARRDLFVGAFFARKTRDALETAPLGEDLNRLDKGWPCGRESRPRPANRPRGTASFTGARPLPKSCAAAALTS